MQDLERLHSLQLLEEFNSLQGDRIHIFCESDRGKYLFEYLTIQFKDLKNKSDIQKFYKSDEGKYLFEYLTIQFKDLKNESDIQKFYKSDGGKYLFEYLRISEKYSDFKEFERIIPFYIDARISKRLEDLTQQDLGLKELLGDDAIVAQVEDKLKAEIASNMRDNKISAKDAFQQVKGLGFWQKILDWLSIFISVNAQLKNTTSKFVQQKLEEKKKDLVSQINNFDVNFSEVPDTNAEISKSANKVGVFEKDGKTVYIKDIAGIKSGFYGAITKVKNEGIRELFGAEFMREMGIANAPKIELVEKNGTTKKIVSYKVGNEGDNVKSLGKVLGANEGLKNLDDVAKEKVKKEADTFFKGNQELKEKVMKLHAISYLMGNRDLHVNNIMVITDKEGKQSVAPIDFGLSGHDMKVLDSWYYKSRFDTTNLHHSDGNILFSENEYKGVFKTVLGEFELKKDAILDKVFYQCRAAGASDAEILGLKQNIEANLAAGKAFLSPEKKQQSAMIR